jgi:RecB family exonuclease
VTKLDDTLFKRITGIKPTAILCIGSGFVREEWKALCFNRGLAISEQGILGPKQIAEILLPESESRLLEGSARVELLRQAFRDSNLREALPTLSQHRFRPRFFEGLDRSIQQGRLLFAHAAEAQVLQDRLTEKTGHDPKREEFFLLNRFWERLLEVRDLFDEPRIYELATEALSTREFSKTIYKLEHFTDPPRLKLFWEELSKRTEVIRFHSSELVDLAPEMTLNRKQAHSLEDAAQFLMDDLLAEAASDPGALDRHAIVIQDEPVIRRTLKRVAELRGIPLQDPRDPTLVVQSEEMKFATLEMALVAKGFPAGLVLAWIATQPELRPMVGEYRKKIIEAGVVQGLQSYTLVPAVKEALTALQNRYPSRLTLSDLHECLKRSAKALALPVWVDSVLERLFSQWKQSFIQIGLEHKKRPLRYWFEQVQEKLRRTTPVVNPLKNRTGLRLFRVDQAISALMLPTENKEALKVHFFGVTPSFFEPREEGNEWFSTRDREILSNEFGLPSYREAQAQAVKSFQGWRAVASAAVFWDYEYDEAGGEAESCDLNLSAIPFLQPAEKEILGAHPLMIPSLQTHLKESSPHVQITLPKTEWPVSFMNAYGNCAFTAYAGFLLSLYDEREADFDLKGDSYGNLVHAALEKMVLEKADIEDAFDHAWKQTKQLAWLKSERLYRAIKYKTVTLLHTFLQSEEEYRAKSGAEPLHIEYGIDWQKDGLTFKGRIDRVDQHADGLVLMDYKTSSVVPSGRDTIEKGMGLQLPLYALALKEKLNQEVVAAQYLQMSPDKVGRNSGILFTQFNQSKKTDAVANPITNARSNSLSLFQETPDVVWARVDAKISELIAKAKAGQFTANPAKPADCARCRYQLVCGRLRGKTEEEQGSESVGTPEAS